MYFVFKLFFFVSSIVVWLKWSNIFGKKNKSEHFSLRLLSCCWWRSADRFSSGSFSATHKVNQSIEINLILFFFLIFLLFCAARHVLFLFSLCLPNSFRLLFFYYYYYLVSYCAKNSFLRGSKKNLFTPEKVSRVFSSNISNWYFLWELKEKDKAARISTK